MASSIGVVEPIGDQVFTAKRQEKQNQHQRKHLSPHPHITDSAFEFLEITGDLVTISTQQRVQVLAPQPRQVAFGGIQIQAESGSPFGRITPTSHLVMPQGLDTSIVSDWPSRDWPGC